MNRDFACHLRRSVVALAVAWATRVAVPLRCSAEDDGNPLRADYFGPFAGMSAQQLRDEKPQLHKSLNYPPQTAHELLMWQWWHAMEGTDDDFAYRTPIEFYGCVLDQFGLPVPGAAVKLEWSALGDAQHAQMICDGSGKFELRGATGKGLTVRVEKPGYSAGKKSVGRFEYAEFFHPDYHCPVASSSVVFRLRKLVSPEPLIRCSVSKELVTDGQVYWVDPTTGAIAAESECGGPDGPRWVVTNFAGRYTNMGVLGVSVQRTDDPATNRQVFTVSIHAAGGGVAPGGDDEFLYEAPVRGFAPLLVVGPVTNDLLGIRGDCTVRAYFRSADGKYGCATIEVGLFRRPGASLTSSIFFNPSGSRNLEWSPDLELAPRAP